MHQRVTRDLMIVRGDHHTDARDRSRAEDAVQAEAVPKVESSVGPKGLH